MTKEEALNKIKELEAFIKECDKKDGVEDDKIFLLSKEEYEKYREAIPNVNHPWWLRSPGCTYFYAAAVRRSGDVSDCLEYMFGDCGIRPALRVNSDKLVSVRDGVHLYSRCSIGERIEEYGYTWIKIAENLAIAEVPIGYEMFDAVSNNYETSHVRKWLKNWLEERK